MSASQQAEPAAPALYDVKAARLVVVADAVGKVAARCGVLWWSTGGPQTIVWHSLDLATLTP